MRLQKILRAVLVSSLVACPAFAQDPADSDIDFTIAEPEAGSTALWAGFYAPRLADALPGNPKVIVQSRHGPASIEGANWFHDQGESDGGLIFGSPASTQFAYLLSDPRVRYDYKGWQAVLASGGGGVVFLPPDLAAKFKGNTEDLKKTFFLFGSQGPTTIDLLPLLAFKMLGLQVNPIFGVTGRDEAMQMFESGETTIGFQTTAAYLKSVAPMVREGRAVPIFSFGVLNAQRDFIRDPNFPDIPTFKEVCEATKGCKTSGAEWEAWKAFFIAGFTTQNFVFLPASATPETVDRYVKAFEDAMAQPDFASAALATFGDYPQMTGETAEAAIAQALGIPYAARDYVLKWLRKSYGAVME